MLNDYIKSAVNLKNQKILLFVTGKAEDSIQLYDLQKLFINTRTPMKVAFKYNDKNNTTKAYDLGREIGQ